LAFVRPSCSSTQFQSSAMPLPVCAEQVKAHGVHPTPGGEIVQCVFRRGAGSFRSDQIAPSALLMATASANSITPRSCLATRRQRLSADEQEEVNHGMNRSLGLPTPTVSTRMLLYPAAHIAASPRECAAPRRQRAARRSGPDKRHGRWMREIASGLSPRMLPPESWLLGSIASTATFCPCSAFRVLPIMRSPIRNMPSRSITLLLPAPGTPVMPTRMELPL